MLFFSYFLDLLRIQQSNYLDQSIITIKMFEEIITSLFWAQNDVDIILQRYFIRKILFLGRRSMSSTLLWFRMHSLIRNRIIICSVSFKSWDLDDNDSNVQIDEITHQIWNKHDNKYLMIFFSQMIAYGSAAVCSMTTN